MIKKEYCRCGPHPLQVTSSRANTYLEGRAGHIGAHFRDFRGQLTLVRKPPLHSEGCLTTSLHLEGPSHECERGVRCRVGSWLDKVTLDAGVIWLTANGWLGRRPPGRVALSDFEFCYMFVSFVLVWVFP